jgi:hypothetical protein
MTATARITLSLLVWYTYLFTTTEAFASYMLSGSGCLTDLSTEEIIMNNQVVDYEDSDHPTVHLDVVNRDDPAIEKMERNGASGATKIWLVPGTATTEEEISLELRLDYDNRVLHDVQFVVETTPGAKFVGGQCDDEKRVASRGSDPVIFKIIPSSDLASAPVQVWGGWATGHEKVRLTPPIEFLVAKPTGGGGDEHDKTERQQEAKPVQARKLEAYQNVPQNNKEEKDGEEEDDDGTIEEHRNDGHQKRTRRSGPGYEAKRGYSRSSSRVGLPKTSYQNILMKMLI